jgi:cytochrome b
MDIKRPVRVWDGPTRLFHWILALATFAALYTGLQGGNLMHLHGRLGLFILGLLVFRIVWGFVGPNTARFAHFVRGPSAIMMYLRGQWHRLGHNPIGALSVLAMLFVLLFQAITGLFSHDDIAFGGPLRRLVAASSMEEMTRWHRLNVWLLGLLVGVHLLAIGAYAYFRKENLVKPMLTGYAESSNPSDTDLQKAPVWGLPLALVVAGLAMWVASGGLLPAAPPPAVLPTW